MLIQDSTDRLSDCKDSLMQIVTFFLNQLKNTTKKNTLVFYKYLKK